MEFKQIVIRCHTCKNKVTGYISDTGILKYGCNKCKSAIYSVKKLEIVGKEKYKTYKINVRRKVNN